MRRIGATYNHLRSMSHTASWNGKVIAESDKVEKVEGNLYFPISSIKVRTPRPAHDFGTVDPVISWHGCFDPFGPAS